MPGKSNHSFVVSQMEPFCRETKENLELACLYLLYISQYTKSIEIPKCRLMRVQRVPLK